MDKRVAVWTPAIMVFLVFLLAVGVRVARGADFYVIPIDVDPPILVDGNLDDWGQRAQSDFAQSQGAGHMEARRLSGRSLHARFRSHGEASADRDLAFLGSHERG